MLTCPICDSSATLFKPAGSIETEKGRLKTRNCPRCDADEWSRLVVAWVKDNVSFPRQGRILTLSCPLALRAGLLKLKNTTLVNAETRDLIGEAFGASAQEQPGCRQEARAICKAWLRRAKPLMGAP